MTAATALAPLPWRAIGFETGPGGEPWYVFDVKGDVVRIRSANLPTVGAIMGLDSDSDRWRAMFPQPNRQRIDTARIAGFLIEQCRAAQRRRDAAQPAENKE